MARFATDELATDLVLERRGLPQFGSGVCTGDRVSRFAFFQQDEDYYAHP